MTLKVQEIKDTIFTTMAHRGSEVMFYVLFTALMLNLAYVLWPVAPETIVVSPHPATLRTYSVDKMPVLVEAESGTAEDKTYLLVDPQAEDGKPPQIKKVIRQSGQSKHGSSKKTFVGKVNLNKATLMDLQLLPGIGPKMAERILAYRKQHGPFSSLAQLSEVSGIGPKKLEKLLPHMSL
jgi:comEA protein